MDFVAEKTANRNAVLVSMAMVLADSKDPLDHFDSAVGCFPSTVTARFTVHISKYTGNEE